MSVINTNIKAMFASDAMNINNRSLSTAMQRLSTGKRINSAADDAAGLAIGTRMDSQVRGLNMAIKNANDTISVTQSAEGAMQEITSILQRMRELSVQSSSDTNSSEDRAFLQQEVGQLSTEIDRIANTTQFNGMNLLDGSWANKTFQIGANTNQTMKFSIGSMKASALGVASSAVGVTPAASSDSSVTGATANGTAAGPTTIKLSFNANDTYGFKLKDDLSGLTADFSAGTALDLSSSISKADFATAVNKSIKESALDTKVTGSVTTLGNATNIDTTPEAVRFNISIGGGAVKNIDLGARLRNTAGVTTTTVTAAQINTALQAELQAQFDNSITLSAGGAAAAFVINDAQGRSIELSQGSGNGAIFGTDSANNGALSAVANPQNNLSVAWSNNGTGNDLLLTNKAGAVTTISSYSATSGASMVFDASGSIPGQVQNPVTLVGAAYSDPKVTANGSTEVTQLAMNFSNRTDDVDKYAFKLTDGSGHVYADLSAGLDVGKLKTDAEVVAAVKTALVNDVAALNDKSITANDFDVTFSGSTLNIKVRDGLSLGVENFVSTVGSATVTPMNELSKSSVLASQNAYQSEVRLGINAAAFNVDLTKSTDGGKFDVYVDGVKSAAGNVDVTAKMDGTYATSKDFGDALATQIQTDLLGISDIAIGASSAMQDLSKVTATYDDTTGQISIKDANGRSISLMASSTNDLTGTGTAFLQDGVTGVANKVAQVKTTSAVAKGGLYNSTQLSVNLSADKVTGLNFKLNGVSLGATSWDSTQPFEGSAAQTALNTMMKTLNADHPDGPYEYAVSGNNITFTRRDGGELGFDTFATASASSAVYATVTPAAGQGTSKVVNYNEVLSTAKASGTASVATSAKLKFNSPDLVGLTISDGSKSYTMANTALDITDRNSVNSFLKTLNKSLAGSNITASMDLQGNMFLNDQLGGQVSVTGYSSAAGQSATWTPASGQGDVMSIQSGFVGTASASGSGLSTLSVGGGSSSVAQVSITTQAGASSAISVIDKALSYVNAERSKLGAIENRLNHTVDNLTNIVTNTSASKSRIVDTDYATETTELARTQIIQQASTAMLAQANQSAQGVLSLLK